MGVEGVDFKLEKIDNKEVFTIKTSYEFYQEHSETIKKNFRWDSRLKVWYTHDILNFINTYNKIAKHTNAKLDPKLANIINSLALSSAVNPTRDFLRKFNLCIKDYSARQYQLAATEYLIRKKKVILADDMGLGKTCSTITALNFLHIRDIDHTVLIITPAHLKLTWIEEFMKFSKVKMNIQMLHGKDIKYFEINPENPLSSSPLLVILINYDIFEKRLYEIEPFSPSIVICDEAHYLKNIKAKRTRAVLSLVKTVEPRYIWLLTGTPIVRDAMNIYSLLKILDHPLSWNWMYFAKKFANMQEVKIKGRTVRKFGITNAEELKTILRSSCMVRRTKDQVLNELPEKSRQMIILDSSEVESLLRREKEILEGVVTNPDNPKQEKEIDQLLETDELPRATELAKIRQQLALKKIAIIANFIDDILQSQEKIVVFAWHHSVISTLRDSLTKVYPESSVKTITGLETMQTKQNIINQFQNEPDPRILICSIAAVGTGVTLTAASTCIFLELDWIPANVMQAEDRLHRIGQKNSVNIYYIVFEKSVESYIAKRMLQRREKINVVMK